MVHRRFQHCDRCSVCVFLPSDTTWLWSRCIQCSASDAHHRHCVSSTAPVCCCEPPLPLEPYPSRWSAEIRQTVRASEFSAFIPVCYRFWITLPVLFCSHFLVCLVSLHISIRVLFLHRDQLPGPNWFHLVLVNLPLLLDKTQSFFLSLSVCCVSPCALFLPFPSGFFVFLDLFGFLCTFWADSLVLTPACPCYLLFNISLPRICSACGFCIWVH